MNVNCGCHNSHICQMHGENRPICLRAEQEEALQLYSGISNAQQKEYAEATKVWRQWARNQMKRTRMPRYLTEARRSYTSKNSALTEEEFWFHNCREDQSRKDRANILPSEVYRLDKTWKPDDVLASVSKLLGIQLSGPQKNERQSMSLHLRDDPKLTLAVFDFGPLTKEPVCPRDNSRLPRQYAVPPRIIAHNRQCVSCGQQLTNQQDWRRHTRKVHKQTWEEAERHLSGTASRVQFVRPCKFCRVHFTKTPQLHSQKCLPLLQLAYIQHHGRSVGPEGGGKTVGHDLANGTHVGRRAGQGSASQVPQNQGAVWAASGKKGLGAEIGPNPGASSTTPDDGEDHCPTRGSPAALGGGSQLDPVHGGRRARHHTTTDADDCDVEEIPHARHMQVRAEASANGGSTHGASGQAAKAGSRCSGPAEALKGQAPQHRAPGVALREVEPGQAMSRAYRGRTSPARQRHQVHASTHGAHGKGRGDTRISCARWDGSGQRQDHNVQTHAVDGGAKEAADPGSAHCPFRLSSPEAHRSETETRKISPSAARGAPGNDPGRRAVSAGSQRGEPSSATNGGIAAPHTELRQTIFTLGRVKQIESLPPGLSQKDLHRVDVKKGKPKSGPSRSGESTDAQSASGSRGDQPTITCWMVQPKPSGDGQNDRKRGASQSDVARQTQSLPNLTLHNPGNHCYLNSLVQALYWIYFAVPSDRNSVFGDPLLRPLLSAKGRVQLLRRSAWRNLLQGWANVNQQQDTAELLEYLRHSIHIPGLRGKWEARTMRGMQVHVHQHMTGAPLIAIPGGRGLGLQRELEMWAYEQDSGHIQALADPPVILSIQILRFRVHQSGEVNKLMDSVPLVHRIYVPRFTLGIETDQTAYELHSAVYHLGNTPHSGHYKALGRMGEAVVPNDQNGPTGNQRGSGGADNTALYCIDDDTQAARVSFSDVHEIQCNWYLAFFLRSQ